MLEEDLNYALEKNQLILHFQPIIDAKTERIMHTEALIRWDHPDFGMVSPAEFIPIAEKTKIINPITYWVIEECCRKLKHWETDGIPNMKVNINLSLVLFENQGDEILDYIISKVKSSGIEPDRIRLEITESSLMNNPGEIISIFRTLKENGFKMALDDFGTGYSSFGYLKDLPLDVIKLDRSLINMVGHDKREQMIAQNMIAIAHGLELKVVAEGVETTEQFEFLKQNNCDYIQGYLFSKPLPEADFRQYYFSKNNNTPRCDVEQKRL